MRSHSSNEFRAGSWQIYFRCRELGSLNNLVGELLEIPGWTNSDKEVRDKELRDTELAAQAAQSCRDARNPKTLSPKILSQKIPSHEILKTTCVRKFPRRPRSR